MSLEGNVCYLIVYHYESNAILGLPISGFDDNTVFAAYIGKQRFQDKVKCDGQLMHQAN
jgi:hypothetical protein